MAFSEFEQFQIDRAARAYVESRRPPPHIRPELDLGFRIVGQSVEIFEVRPAFNRPDETIEHGIAKATWVKSRHLWKIYWLRADLKWHRYEPQATVATIDEFFAVVDEDAYGCFFG